MIDYSYHYFHKVWAEWSNVTMFSNGKKVVAICNRNFEKNDSSVDNNLNAITSHILFLKIIFEINLERKLLKLRNREMSFSREIQETF